jgi:hypothetical protein
MFEVNAPDAWTESGERRRFSMTQGTEARLVQAKC